ncbi:MAG TPA: TAXI family TRAP transporter solute-binding subunit [Chloroflexota bacterium]
MQERRFVEPTRPGGGPPTQRSRLMLEVASELVGTRDWPDKQVIIKLREQDAPEWAYTFFASDAPNSIGIVASGEADFAICNPGGVLAMAYKGAGPYPQPIPVRTIMVFPQFDRWGFAVTADTGITSIQDIVDRKYPLKLSLRGGRENHAVHIVTDLILAAYGFSLKDVADWGGELRYTPGLPTAPGRLSAIASGELNAVIDEGFHNYTPRALELGMRYLSIDEPHLQQLEKLGLRRQIASREEFPGLHEDLWTIDFSGWPAFCMESTPDELVTKFCTALEARKDRIPWYGDGPLDLKLMVSDHWSAPMMVPLHPAAERFWKQQGYL